MGLDLAGADTWLRGRKTHHTRDVAEALAVQWLEPEQPAPDGAVLVNATPLGSAEGDPSPFSEAEVEGASAVIDMVYGKVKPALAKMAEGQGVPYLDGRTVLAHQGFAQFAAFTGQLPPKEEMLRAVQRTNG